MQAFRPPESCGIIPLWGCQQMLDKQSKLVLDSIIANESQYERYFLQKDKPLDISDDEMERILCGLAAGGYVTLDDINGCIYGAHLTQKGFCYKEYQRLERADRWKERAYGFVSGAIIASIPWLLGLIRLPK